MKRLAERTIAVLAATVLLCSANTVLADKKYEQSQDQSTAVYASRSLSADLSAATVGGQHILPNDGVLTWEENSGDLAVSFVDCENAAYNIEIVWKPFKSGVNPNIGVKLDGEFRYDELREIELLREWKNISDTPNKDAAGNEYAPEQIETGEFITSVLKDFTGRTANPFLIHTSRGNHTLQLLNSGQTLIIKSIRLLSPDVPESYSEVSSNYKSGENKGTEIVIEAESADVKTSKTLIPKSNNSDPGMSPTGIYSQKINYIGGTSWQTPGSALTWKFNVENPGYYRLAFRYKQSDLINGNSLRILKIDGKIPFEEASHISFPYTTRWKNYIFKSEDNDGYLIALESGEHTITLETTVGEGTEFVNRLSDITEKLGDRYIDIIMVTGEIPDANTDYEIFNQVPQLEETFSECSKKLELLAKDMKTYTDGGSTQSIAAVENMKRVIDNMLRGPYIAQQYLSDYYSNYTSLCSWLGDMTSMPLALDTISFIPSDEKAALYEAGFFEKFAFGVKKLAVSFMQDYTLNGGKKTDGKSVKLWVSWGQEQAAALSNIISDSFTSSTGISVDLEIVNASLINGILAGNFPDVSLQMSRTEPINLGIRGALCDLSRFEDLDAVLERFLPGAEAPYRYNGKLYALPDSQSFFIMFLRTDIMKNLELKTPETWEEFLHTAAIIQRNNMNVYLPYTQITSVGTVNSGIGSLNMLPTLFAQNGLSFFNEGKNATALTGSDAVGVFEKWTEFYTDYNFLKEADFYNRFRLGSMPLGIAPIATYMSLYAAAPEIKGRWTIAAVPGTVTADGDINRSIAGAGTGCAIIEKSEKKDEAWEFLKWWTSAAAQERYNNSIESILGVISRTSPSNIEAFDSFAWDPDDLNVIKKQRTFIKEIDEIPGSYYLSRAIDQAFWDVINNESNAKDALVKWRRVANNEIKRKINEYS